MTFRLYGFLADVEEEIIVKLPAGSSLADAVRALLEARPELSELVEVRGSDIITRGLTILVDGRQAIFFESPRLRGGERIDLIPPLRGGILAPIAY